MHVGQRLLLLHRTIRHGGDTVSGVRERIAAAICEVFHPGANHDLPLITCTRALAAADAALRLIVEHGETCLIADESLRHLIIDALADFVKENGEGCGDPDDVISAASAIREALSVNTQSPIDAQAVTR